MFLKTGIKIQKTKFTAFQATFKKLNSDAAHQQQLNFGAQNFL
jgi:hypothetical protein